VHGSKRAPLTLRLSTRRPLRMGAPPHRAQHLPSGELPGHIWPSPVVVQQARALGRGLPSRGPRRAVLAAAAPPAAVRVAAGGCELLSQHQNLAVPQAGDGQGVGGQQAEGVPAAANILEAAGKGRREGWVKGASNAQWAAVARTGLRWRTVGCGGAQWPAMAHAP
jgi:hypothetical protein